MTPTNPSQPVELAPSTPAVPGACSLSPTAFEERIAYVRREISPHALARLRVDDGVAWEFEAQPDMRAKLEEWARLERECCDGVGFEVWQSVDGKRLRFEIRGIDADTRILDRMGLAIPLAGETMDADAQRDDSDVSIRALGGWKPLARRGGIAAVVAVALCCVAPIALVSVAGLAAAAPLLKLDNPIAIAGSTVAVMTLLWLFEKRRARLRLANATANSAINASQKNAGCGC